MQTLQAPPSPKHTPCTPPPPAGTCLSRINAIVAPPGYPPTQQHTANGQPWQPSAMISTPTPQSSNPPPLFDALREYDQLVFVLQQLNQLLGHALVEPAPVSSITGKLGVALAHNKGGVLEGRGPEGAQ